MVSIKRLIPLLTAAGILLAGNGLQGTLIAIFGKEANFSTFMIGLMGTSYFLGYMAGCIIISRILTAVGHIRAFCSMAAIAACVCLLLPVIIDPFVWIVLRFIAGVCFASLLSTVESWINSEAQNTDRGRLLSIYRLVDLTCVTGSQFMLPIFGVDNFVIFSVMAILVTLSLVPISLADKSNPRPPRQVKFSLRPLWEISPISCISCIAIGITGSAFRAIGPIYAQAIGMSVAAVATFMSAGIIGGAVLQFQLGSFSDRVDRRWALIIASSGAALAGMFISLFAGTNEYLNYIGIFTFGAFALPLYSLAAAHANDHAKDDDFVQIATGLIFFWAIGAVIGPAISSLLMQTFGPNVLFVFTSVVHVALVFLTLIRMRVRPSVPADERKGRFHTLLRTSPMMAKLTRKKN